MVLRKVFTALDVKTWHKMRVRLWCSIRIDILIDEIESRNRCNQRLLTKAPGFQ